MSVRRRYAATRIGVHPYASGRSHGWRLPSGRLTSSSEKNRQSMSRSTASRTRRIQTDVWYAHGHIGSK